MVHVACRFRSPQPTRRSRIGSMPGPESPPARRRRYCTGRPRQWTRRSKRRCDNARETCSASLRTTSGCSRPAWRRSTRCTGRSCGSSATGSSCSLVSRMSIRSRSRRCSGQGRTSFRAAMPRNSDNSKTFSSRHRSAALRPSSRPIRCSQFPISSDSARWRERGIAR